MSKQHQDIKSHHGEWTSSQVYSKCRREAADDGTPPQGGWERTKPKKKVILENIASAYQGEKNLSRDLSLGSDIPTPGLISRESHHSKRHVTPPFTATPPSVPEPESQEHFN